MAQSLKECSVSGALLLLNCWLEFPNETIVIAVWVCVCVCLRKRGGRGMW